MACAATTFLSKLSRDPHAVLHGFADVFFMHFVVSGERLAPLGRRSTFLACRSKLRARSTGRRRHSTAEAAMTRPNDIQQHCSSFWDLLAHARAINRPQAPMIRVGTHNQGLNADGHPQGGSQDEATEENSPALCSDQRGSPCHRATGTGCPSRSRRRSARMKEKA